MSERIGISDISPESIAELSAIDKRVSDERNISESVGEIDIDPKGYAEVFASLEKRVNAEENTQAKAQLCDSAKELLDEYIAYHYQKGLDLPADTAKYRELFSTERK